MSGKSPKTVLLIGGSGTMGTAVRAVFSGQFAIVAPDSALLNIFNRDDALRQIKDVNPDVLIYAPTYEPKNDNDEEVAKTYRINTAFPTDMAAVLDKRKTSLFIFSSDWVFPGGRDAPYTENDQPLPNTLFALTKFGADALLPQILPKTYIMRMPRIFGPTHSSTLRSLNKTIHAYLKGENIELISDVHKCVCYSIDAAKTMLSILNSSYNMQPGIYHIFNDGAPSMFEFFYEMSKYIKTKSILFEIFRSKIRDCKISPTTILTSVKIRPMRPWQDALAEYCREYWWHLIC
jgi:dTDP-4-dehydrorhamnose reductase